MSVFSEKELEELRVVDAEIDDEFDRAEFEGWIFRLLEPDFLDNCEKGKKHIHDRVLRWLNRDLVREKKHLYYMAHREKMLEIAKESYEKNRLHNIERSKSYYREHREEILKRVRDERARDGGEHARKAREHYWKNRDVILERKRIVRKNDGGEHARKAREYYRKNRDLINERKREKRRLLREGRDLDVKCEVERLVTD